MKLRFILLPFLTFVGSFFSESIAQRPESEKGTQRQTQSKVTHPFEGGEPNKIAQLDTCKELVVVPFSDLKQINNAALTLLTNTYGEKAETVYNKESVYSNAVLLNTAAAAASIGANLSKAVILKLYLSAEGSANSSFQKLPFGLYIKGFTGIPTPPPGRNSTSDRYRDLGSVEVQTDENGDTHFDVDLYNPKSDYYVEHWEEVLFNEKYGRPTHPGDVVKQVYEDRKLRTGVNCKN